MPTGNVNLDNLYQVLIQRGISADLAADFVRRVRHPMNYFDLPQLLFNTFQSKYNIFCNYIENLLIHGNPTSMARQC